MSLITHEQLVKSLVKPGAVILAEMRPQDAHLIHMVVGLTGEVGELTDAIKKRVMYGKCLDIVNVIEELGDLEFYMEGLRQSLSISREETIQANIAKLSKRYENLTYSNEAAIARADKV